MCRSTSYSIARRANSTAWMASTPPHRRRPEESSRNYVRPRAPSRPARRRVRAVRSRVPCYGNCSGCRRAASRLRTVSAICLASQIAHQEGRSTELDRRRDHNRGRAEAVGGTGGAPGAFLSVGVGAGHGPLLSYFLLGCCESFVFQLPSIRPLASETIPRAMSGARAGSSAGTPPVLAAKRKRSS